MNIRIILSIACGGAAGSLLRAFLSTYIESRHHSAALATFVVNVLGSIALGLLAECAGRLFASPVWRAAIVTGVLGGFTTFSAFAGQLTEMHRQGRATTAILYAAAQVFVSVGAIDVIHRIASRFLG